MRARFEDVCEYVLQFRDQKSIHIRRSVIDLLPRLALFDRHRFSRKHLSVAANHLIGLCHLPTSPTPASLIERQLAYIALGQLIIASRSDILPHVDEIFTAIREALSIGPPQKSKKVSCFCTEVLFCIGSLAVGIPSYVFDRIAELLGLFIPLPDCFFCFSNLIGYIPLSWEFSAIQIERTNFVLVSLRGGVLSVCLLSA